MNQVMNPHAGMRARLTLAQFLRFPEVKLGWDMIWLTWMILFLVQSFPNQATSSTENQKDV